MGDRGDAVHMRLLAVPAAASLVRERMRGWLGALGWAEADLDDVVLAVHEAVTNSIEHGYAGCEPGEVEVVGTRTVDGGVQRARFTVRDEGRWRPPRDPGFRGRGITVMRGCMAEVTIRPGEGGTEVELLSRPVPAHRSRTSAPMSVPAPEVRSAVQRYEP
ncbi:ATP-binding protein [Pseudonocardia sp.]|uniref:ATP-binding protein n=1 Tax=Pseudonocardia sp. TaxID=60912 RepID=UPI00260FE821|nr:ATP-binding protein [Pseudonocardia sp.]